MSKVVLSNYSIHLYPKGSNEGRPLLPEIRPYLSEIVTAQLLWLAPRFLIGHAFGRNTILSSSMAIGRWNVTFASITALAAWAIATSLIPSLQWMGYAFGFGSGLSILALMTLLLRTSRGCQYIQKHVTRRSRGPAFIAPRAWNRELDALRSREAYTRKVIYPESSLISEALDGLLDLILRDFVNVWYSSISKNPIFSNEVDKSIRLALATVRDRLLAVDLTEVATTRFVPILTAHFKDFYEAERIIRGKHLNHGMTESEELDLAIASKYKTGKLHSAASLSYSDTKLVQQEHLRSLARSLLPKILPNSSITSGAVGTVIQEIVACAVLFPLMEMISDPDTWNQIMESYGRTMLQDRSTVRKLRAALDEHASPAPKAKSAVPIPRLCAGDHERKFEKFIRAIRKVNNLSDARRFRSEISSQLKRDSLQDGQDPVYLRRLDIGKKILEHRVNELSATGDLRIHAAHRSVHNGAPIPQLEHGSLTDLLHDPSGLSYFMEYMDRQNLMTLVQFWIVVDGIRTPLQDDSAEDDGVASTIAKWTEADRTDLAQINEAYLSKPELTVPESSRQHVHDFLSAGNSATPRQYFMARKAILHAQSKVLEYMQENHYAGFKTSDLFYKCLTSQEASKSLAAQGPSMGLATLDLSSPNIPTRASDLQILNTKPGFVPRIPGKLLPRRNELQGVALSYTDVSTTANRPTNSLTASRLSYDEESSSPLPEDDGFESEAMNSSTHSLNHAQEAPEADKKVVQAIEAALNNILEDAPNTDDLRPAIFGDDDVVGFSNHTIFSPFNGGSLRNSLDGKRTDLLNAKSEKPSIASLGLVNTSSRIGVFTDDDLFPDEEKFISDEHEDPHQEKEGDVVDEVHEAAPGDLGLAEAITILTTDIERLTAQDAVVDSLTRKAELTNNTAELRILRKSKASLQREMRRKELQRQQYMVQESDNSLYGRSTIKIKSIGVCKEGDGREYALYVVEVQRKAGEQMPAATWTITRRYSEFHELHQRLRGKYPSVRNLDFPRRRMVLKLQPDFLHKRRLALENYLRDLLLLPDVCRSRDLRAFLSQSAIAPAVNGLYPEEAKKDMMTRFYNSVTDGMEDILGNIPVLDQLSVAGQNLLSAATSQLITMPAGISEDPLSAAEAEAELNAFDDRELEPFVKPICDIFLEVFELNRGNNWLRGRAVVVVLHQLLGGTIERKVRESVRGLLQEEAIHKYIKLVEDAMWPAGSLKRGAQVRVPAAKSKSRHEASLMLATLVPDLAAGVVGRVNAQAASRRIFATFNNHRLNTHLAFTLLDDVLDVLFRDTRV